MELKNDMEQVSKDEISSNKVKLVTSNVNLQKGQEIVKKCISTLKANVNKEMQTSAEIVKAQAKHVKKKLKQKLP